MSSALSFGCGSEHSGEPTPTPPVFIVRDGITLVVRNDSPMLEQAPIDRVVDAFFTIYPLESSRFNPAASTTVYLTFAPSNNFVASTSGNRITFSAPYLLSHHEDIDVITHEAMHVVQAYPSGNPGWITEGIADYARDAFGVNNSAAGWSLPNYASGQNYTDSYRVTARFFKWIEVRLKSTFVEDLDQAMRAGTYDAGFWTTELSGTVDDVWAQYTLDPTI